MTDLNLGLQPAINWPALDAELRAALPGLLDGASYAKGALIVHVTDGVDAEALRPTIAAVLAAHDPDALTAEQQAEQATRAAADTLRAADFRAVRAAIQNATTLAALRPILLAMLRLIWLVAKAQRLTDAADVEA